MNDQAGLTGTCVLITGASRGIGRACAIAFAERGARVAVHYGSNRAAAEHTLGLLAGKGHIAVQADITDASAVHALVEDVAAGFGRIDVLVNNAGAIHGGRLVDLDAARIEQVLRLNLWASIRLTQLVLPAMLAQHSGYILNVASGLGRVAVPQVSTYVASKYGLAGFTDALRRELGGSGVRLTLILPSWTHTDMLAPETKDVLERYGFRINYPDEVAEQAVAALVAGRHEVILGGPLALLGVAVERYFPFLLRLYWRLFMTQEWSDAMAALGGEEAR